MSSRPGGTPTGRFDGWLLGLLVLALVGLGAMITGGRLPRLGRTGTHRD